MLLHRHCGIHSYGGHGGSGLSSIGGSIRTGELVPGGAIHHALKIDINAPQIAYNNDGTPGYRWPALQADAYASSTKYTGTVSALEMGALLALRPDFDTTQLKSQPAKIISRALREYGAYLVDDAARDCFAIPTAWEASGRVREEFERVWGLAFITNWPAVAGMPNSADWLSDLGVLARNCCVISNNDSGNIGGRPTSDLANRRAPIAPDLSRSTRIAANSRHFIRKADNHISIYSLSGKLIDQSELSSSRPYRDVKRVVPVVYVLG